MSCSQSQLWNLLSSLLDGNSEPAVVEFRWESLTRRNVWQPISKWKLPMPDRCYPWWSLYNTLKAHVKCTTCDLQSLHFRRSMTILRASWRLNRWVLHGMNGLQKGGNLWCYGRVSIALFGLLNSLSWSCLVIALLFYCYIALIVLFKARRLFSASWSAFTNISILIPPKEHVKTR